ncbi:DUF1501 domain-containing protein [Lignipirellula cremea]|uniref:DUF1501 domain-containing protein n=1 Tax=Lignipirellula cremea TaxID=2528010 RepID=A0A518DKD9_9BACT|nr:DUF1501 domain-containing protein [Lignipirellula cremea]QDU92303.1 hypothetical protein Pla8534_00480 [Lignipirellula cremea]
MRYLRETLPRRDWLKLSAAGLLSGASVPWFESLARAAIKRPRGKACILLWMDGGPSQQHTFDPKPKGEFKSMSTSVPGIHIVEQLPQLAQSMEDLAIVRSMSTEINGHYDAKYFLHTGYKRTTAFEHPSIGSIASSQIGLPDDDMPAFVTVDAGFDRADGGRLYRSVPAYLGPTHAPLAVLDPSEGLENLTPSGDDIDARLELLAGGEQRFAERYALPAVGAKQSAFNRAVRLMHSKRSRAFRLDEEPEKLREAYGQHKFGQSCLLARRLVEAGVSFVEVIHRGWDDHSGAAKPIAARAPWMDAGMATLIRDLKQRGMLDDTLVVWMGEFGRSPGNGAGHFCRAWSSVFAGGGLNTGQVIGKTSEDGKNPGNDIVDRPVSAPDFMATLCLALGMDIHQEFLAPGLRPIPLVEKTAKPILELLG